MTVYLINIVMTLFIAYLTLAIQSFTKISKNKVKIAYGGIIVILFLWVLVYALRDNVGSDYIGYQYYYYRIGTLNQNFQEFIASQRDFLYGSLEYLCYKFSNGSWIIFLIVLGIITYLPVLATLRKQSPNFVISILIYIFMLTFYSGFNGTRQAIAVGLSFYAYYNLFKEQKYKRYIIIMAMAYGFHSTILFVLPFHLLSKKDFKSKMFKLVVALMLFAYVFLWNLWMYLINFFDLIGQDKLANDYASATADGSSGLRLMVYLMPVILALIFYKQIKKKYARVDCEIMFMVIAAVFMLFSTKYWLFARVADYFAISTVLFIPKLECIFKDNSKRIGMLVITAFYFCFMCMMLLHGEGGYYPYKMIL